ncbi:MAG TPA: radical SAM protein, partial [Stenomitos sp.]
NGRLERAITPDLLQLLHESGLRMVLWGFESGSDRILDLIKKGIDPERRYDILQASNDAGIWNFAYIFFGFPSETREEAMSTIEAICRNTNIIHSYGRSVFTLGKQSPLFLEAAAHGIVDVMEDLEELSTNLHYRTTLGMDNAELNQVLKLCTQQCSEAYGYGLWFFLRYRENIHLYVAKYGLEHVKNYKMERYIIPKTCEEVF